MFTLEDCRLLMVMLKMLLEMFLTTVWVWESSTRKLNAATAQLPQSPVSLAHFPLLHSADLCVQGLQERVKEVNVWLTAWQSVIEQLSTSKITSWLLLYF